MEPRDALNNPFAAPVDAGKQAWTDAEWNWLFAKTWMFGGVVALAIGGSIMDARRDWVVNVIGGVLGSAAYGCFCMGAACWAKSKGRSAWFGLLGLLGLMAPLILVLLSERKNSLALSVIPDDYSAEPPNLVVKEQIDTCIGDWIDENGERARVGVRSSNE